MSDETRRLLKVFGVAVTDFEDEAARLGERADGLPAGAAPAETARLLKDTAELCRELHARWFDVTRLVVESEQRLLSRVAAAAARLA